MPHLTKEVLSKYVTSECKRQLRLSLSPATKAHQAERAALHMPPPQPPRPGLEQFAQAGEEWQAAKLHDLTETFGAGAVVGRATVQPTGRIRYQPVPLLDALVQAKPGQFLVEAEFEIGAAFVQALDLAGLVSAHGLAFGHVRPDLVEVLPPGTFSTRVLPAGDVEPLPAGDQRRQLRVIDIKLTARPSTGYFAEVAYYTMALAAWLVDRQIDDAYAVVPDGAVWPGSHDAARLTVAYRALVKEGKTPTLDDLRPALAEDLEPVPFEVLAYRIRRFLQEVVPEVLSADWPDLPWHVDHRCKQCEYLGYPWIDAHGQPTAHPAHCMPTALHDDHLSRVAFVSRGAGAALRSRGVQTVAGLAARLPADAVFDAHQTLRAGRSVVPRRANALVTEQPEIPADSGTSAVMPRWADLRLYLSTDFDASSAITVAFGLKAFWVEPRPYGSTDLTPRATQSWKARVLVVDQRDVAVEQRELLAFLEAINDILTWARSRSQDTTMQVYLWDSLQYEHLARVVGRHLPAILANQSIQHLAWLFPPEQLLPNPALATRRSPITIVREVARCVLAAPIAHYYSLLAVARVYHRPDLPENVANFSVHPLFEDALSDQIPSERAHGIWTRATRPRHWSDQVTVLQETVVKRLNALETVAERLQSDLGNRLAQVAPQIAIGPPTRQSRVSADGQLWHAFAKLDAALAALDVHTVRAMPPHEREARFHSARLVQRLTGAAEQEALGKLKIGPAPHRRVYTLSPRSREVKAREGDFGFALAPEAEVGFLDRGLATLARGTALEPNVPNPGTRVEEITQVTVVALDRDLGLMALDPNGRSATWLDDLEAAGIADFSQNAVLDPTYHDYFTPKLLKALQAIGNPLAAQQSPLVQQAVGLLIGKGARRTPPTPVADVLWNGPAMAASPVNRSLDPARTALEQAEFGLNGVQWEAWTAALTHRLQLLWGPPGTGKSRTAAAVVLGAALAALAERRPIRILVCASTYTAVDNVLLPVVRWAETLLSSEAVAIVRLRSYLQQPQPGVPPAVDVPLNRRQPSPAVTALRARLAEPDGVTIVGAPPEQVHNLMTIEGGSAQQEWFDLILIDEASQMDVNHAIVALCSLAAGGSVVLAGDPKQLPPIHQAQAPAGLEAMVGSIYAFCESVHGLTPIMLTESYRSNATLVAFAHRAGYLSGLRSYSPDLRLHFVQPLPGSRPADWPEMLYWTPEWSALLDPDRPAVCFVYREGRSSQWNAFEADAVAALIHILAGRLGKQLVNERDPATGMLIPTVDEPYAPGEFWAKAVGVVTPHRAQQGLIVGRLQQVFAGMAVPQSAIRDAVDTVERFQGQQRDVIIATFALGDPDAIADEDEFLLSLNRFNVMASRARAKLVVLVSQELVDHLSSDPDILRESRLLKTYVESFCRNPEMMVLGHIVQGLVHPVEGIARYRGVP
ncbi:MAG: ATP-binding protein [Chloroflexi bacterium]|nr:ATP-binding protein [Chloroflexota bacterium]